MSEGLVYNIEHLATNLLLTKHLTALGVGWVQIRVEFYSEQHPLRNRIPMIWVGGAVKAPRRIDTICNQTDLPATLLAQLGLSHSDYTFSRDVLSSTYTHPVAMHTFTEGYSMVDSTGLTVFDLYSQRVTTGKGDITIAQAILQAATKDLNQR